MSLYAIQYIEYTQDGKTYLDIYIPARNEYKTFGPYKPRPGFCPRCRSPKHHTVGGVARCTTCRHYWPNPQNLAPGEVARIDIEEP